MSDEMDEIRNRSKAKQEELAKTYPQHIILRCETQGCKNTITFENESDMDEALTQGKPYCPECVEKRLGA